MLAADHKKKTKSKNALQYTKKDKCISNNGVPCQMNKRCGIEDAFFLCNESKIFCLKSHHVCDSKSDCSNEFIIDSTDETNCKSTFLNFVEYD